MSCLNLDEDKNSILGILDELNSFIGFTKCFTNSKRFKHTLTVIQNDIFLIQAEIANPTAVLYKPSRIDQDHVRYIEMQTSLTDKHIKEIDHFIIPEGTKFACALHCVRTISRRVEREILKYGRQEKAKLLNAAALNKDLKKLSLTIDLYARYFDRVACLTFAMARLENNRLGRRERKPSYYRDESILTKENTKRRRKQ